MNHLDAPRLTTSDVSVAPRQRCATAPPAVPAWLYALGRLVGLVRRGWTHTSQAYEISSVDIAQHFARKRSR